MLALPKDGKTIPASRYSGRSVFTGWSSTQAIDAANAVSMRRQVNLTYSNSNRIPYRVVSLKFAQQKSVKLCALDDLVFGVRPDFRARFIQSFWPGRIRGAFGQPADGKGGRSTYGRLVVVGGGGGTQ